MTENNLTKSHASYKSQSSTVHWSSGPFYILFPSFLIYWFQWIIDLVYFKVWTNYMVHRVAVSVMVVCILTVVGWLIFVNIFTLTDLICWQLPLPFLKVGYLTAPPAGNPLAPHSDWKRTQFVLNHEGLQQVSANL